MAANAGVSGAEPLTDDLIWALVSIHLHNGIELPAWVSHFKAVRLEVSQSMLSGLAQGNQYRFSRGNECQDLKVSSLISPWASDFNSGGGQSHPDRSLSLKIPDR